MPTHDQIAGQRFTLEKFLDVVDCWNTFQSRIDMSREVIASCESDIAVAQAGQAALQPDIDRYYAAAAVFDFDLSAATQFALAQRTAATKFDPAVMPPTAEMPDSGVTTKDFVLRSAMLAYPAPVRAAGVRQRLFAELGRTVHPKTVSMTMYRWLREGLMRREGINWFYVPPPEKDEAPAEVTEASLFD